MYIVIYQRTGLSMSAPLKLVLEHFDTGNQAKHRVLLPNQHTVIDLCQDSKIERSQGATTHVTSSTEKTTDNDTEKDNERTQSTMASSVEKKPPRQVQ